MVLKNEAELKQIAVDLYDGKIFCDRHISESQKHLIKSVFVPFVFMEQKDVKQMQDDKVSFIYEYLDNASPRGINGMPSFFSMRYLNEDDTKKMFEIYEDYKKIKEGFLETKKSPKPKRKKKETKK